MRRTFVRSRVLNPQRFLKSLTKTNLKRLSKASRKRLIKAARSMKA